jgi:hypothetical protein
MKPGTWTHITDMPSFAISVVSGGKTKRVTLYEGCLGNNIPSEQLRWLTQTIDYVV